MKTEKFVTTREASATQEYRIAKKLGGKISPNSGAGLWDKSDVTIQDASMNIECKTCTKPKLSFSIKKEWFEKNKKDGFVNRLHNHVVAFNFFYDDETDYYIIDDKLMKFLVEKIIEENEEN